MSFYLLRFIFERDRDTVALIDACLHPIRVYRQGTVLLRPDIDAPLVLLGHLASDWF